MPQFKIGIMLDSLRLPVDQALTQAANMGAEGFQVYCTGGALHPDNFAKPARKQFLARIKELGLAISAFCGELGGFVVEPAEAEKRTAETLKYLDLCADMKVRVLSAHIGSFSGQPGANVDACRKALHAIGARAAKLGLVYATETGAEPAPELRKFLDELRQPGIAVNFDPANLVMQGWDHLDAVKILAPYIAHTHAKDGLFGQHKEVALGQGNVDFKKWIENLNAVGYKGFLAIEREVGPDPIADISAAIGFLKKLRTA